MRNDIRDQRRVSRWALPASLVLHSLIAALLVFGLPVSLFEPLKEEAIKVELVPPPPEKAEGEPPPPAEESKSAKPQEAKVETPPPASDDAARQGPSPVLKPVVQFGEKDAGPRESPEGESAEDGSASPTALPDRDKQDLAESAALAAAEAMNKVPLPGAAEVPAPKPADAAAETSPPLKLQEATTLFSQTATGDLTATTAMRDVPRGVRAGRLCLTELREQLLNALPPYFPDLLPSDRLKEGTVIEIPGAAFRANGQWYDLSYRCEVDTGATKVVSFALRVGDPVPRGEWKRRGLPSR